MHVAVFVEGSAVEIDTETETVEIESAGWDLKAIGQVTQDGEDQYQIDKSGVAWVEIDGAESLDPPATFPADPPRPRYEDTTLGRY